MKIPAGVVKETGGPPRMPLVRRGCDSLSCARHRTSLDDFEGLLTFLIGTNCSPVCQKRILCSQRRESRRHRRTHLYRRVSKFQFKVVMHQNKKGRGNTEMHSFWSTSSPQPDPSLFLLLITSLRYRGGV